MENYGLEKGENEDFLISAFFKPLKRFVTRGVFYPTVETVGYGWVLSKGVEFDRFKIRVM